MKRALSWLLVGMIFLLTCSCKSGANFTVHNQCAHPAYASVNRGDLVTIPPYQTHVFYIDTDSQNLFTGSVFRTVPVTLYGETYAMILQDSPVTYTDSTTIKVQAGRTLNAYLNPNRACVKVVNNSSRQIERAEIWKHTSLSHSRVSSLVNISAGSSAFQRVDYATPNNQFYYQVELYFAGELEPLVYGDVNNILNKDEQFVVTYNDPE